MECVPGAPERRPHRMRGLAALQGAKDSQSSLFWVYPVLKRSTGLGIHTPPLVDHLCRSSDTGRREQGAQNHAVVGDDALDGLCSALLPSTKATE